MPGVSVPDAARAFEFNDDGWSLTLVAARYELEEVKRTSIERALVRMVVTRGEEVAVQAIYRLRSARQRIAIKLPAGVDPATAFDTQPLKINNQPVTLEKDKNQFYIPLVGHSTDTPILVELRYTQTGSPAALELPEFPDNPAVQQVHLAAYLPEEQTLLAVGGPWTDEQALNWNQPRAEHDVPSDQQLLDQVRAGVAVKGDVGSGFPLDGSRHLFSALRPAAGPAGALRLTTAHRNVVHVLTFLIVAFTGLALTFRSVGERLWGLAALVVALVFIAVFAPTLARALVTPTLWAAIGLVLLVWVVRCLAWAVPKIAVWINSRPARAAVAAGAVAAAASAPVATGETPFAPLATSGEVAESPPAPPPDPDAEKPEGGEHHG
jgi:hypothetical protein